MLPCCGGYGRELVLDRARQREYARFFSANEKGQEAMGWTGRLPEVRSTVRLMGLSRK